MGSEIESPPRCSPNETKFWLLSANICDDEKKRGKVTEKGGRNGKDPSEKTGRMERNLRENSEDLRVFSV